MSSKHWNKRPWYIRVIQLFEKRCCNCGKVATFVGTGDYGYCHTHCNEAFNSMGGWRTGIKSTGWMYNEDIPAAQRKENLKSNDNGPNFNIHLIIVLVSMISAAGLFVWIFIEEDVYYRTLITEERVKLFWPPLVLIIIGYLSSRKL